MILSPSTAPRCPVANVKCMERVHMSPGHLFHHLRLVPKHPKQDQAVEIGSIVSLPREL